MATPPLLADTDTIINYTYLLATHHYRANQISAEFLRRAEDEAGHGLLGSVAMTPVTRYEKPMKRYLRFLPLESW